MAIQLQARNWQDFAKPDKAIFTNMDPFAVGLTLTGKNAPLVINIIFSLGDLSASVLATAPPERLSTRIKTSRTLTFDIFVCSTSPASFNLITESDMPKWKAILECTGVDMLYGSVVSTIADSCRRSMHIGMTSDPAHWDQFFPLDAGK
jgi:hypothetical protein